MSYLFIFIQKCTKNPEQDLAILVEYLAATSHMNTPKKPRPSVTSGCKATDQGVGQTCGAAEGAKNVWIQTGHHWNLNLATFNVTALLSGASRAMLLEQLATIPWNAIWLGEVRRTGERYNVYKRSTRAKPSWLNGKKQN